jgi:amino acid adenylation domain-containing protein
MEKKSKFSCVIIGGGTLPIRCAETLLNKDCEIRAVVSSDAQVIKWTNDNKITHLKPDENLADNLREQPFDYLFSIVNEHILRDDVLRQACKLAINYHDAPLPKYAGTHATSWAMLNGEKTHGISWHVITDVVDAGDILQSQTVEIGRDDTALTLNTKCYEAAINSFARLVEELKNESISPVKQNLANRTFFPRFKRPPNGCVISWNSRADEISALVRALNFGHHPNPLGAAKIFIGDEFYIVRDLEILDSVSKNPPGTINKIEADCLQISAADKEIVLRKIFRLDGSPISLSELAEKFDLSVGKRLAELDAETAQRLGELIAKTCRHEKFWVEKLLDLELIAAPFSETVTLSDAANYTVAEIPIPVEFSNLTNKQSAENERQNDDLLIASFAILLARLGGVSKFDVGFRDGEMRSETGGLENFFAPLIAARFEIDLLRNFSENLEKINEQIVAIKKRKYYPHDILARFPQLQTAAEKEFAPAVAVEKVARYEDYKSENAAHLTLVIADDSKCRFVYDGKHLSAENVEKIISHFTTLLCAIAENPQSPAAHLSILTAEERRKLLFEWNDNRRDFPKNLCIQQLFEAQVSRTPNATALIFGERRVTYRELNNRANRLARHLQKLGVEPESLTAICVERSIEMIVGILAILKAGGAYVPLDPNYPRERLAYMLEDSNAAVILTTQNLLGELDSRKAKTVCFDRDSDQISQESEDNLTPTATAENLAYVIYTSGSTGKPKGVAIEHRSAAAFTHWANSVFTPEHLKGVLASTSICFDLSVYEIFAPLSCGGAIVLVENILHLPTCAARNEVTLINTVPSAIAELLRIEGVPNSVRTVNLAGEPLKTSLVKKIYSLPNVREVFDLYGPSEDTTYSTFTLRDEGAATIGRPISNTQAYILDANLQPVPIGISGELYLGGEGLARGYLNRPELTNERFIKNPFDQNHSKRLYKTGDLTRYKSNGEIEYLGRIDNQVKIRGFRIELGEIENRLLNHASIKEAIVIADENQAGEKRLVAYIVPKDNESLKISELREFIKQTLPEYMCPAAFVELPEMPLTPNGKINRKALPAPSDELSIADRNFVAHRNDLESQLVEMWESILQIRPIGINDDFFELGGHSLQAVRMFAEIEKTFNVNIPLATLFQAGTIGKLAEILRQDGWAEPESSLVPIQPKGTKPKFFCVHAKGGNVLFYRDLSRHLGDDQPFYGIQARRLGGRQVGHDRIEDMAEFYIKEIQKIQPEGPYYLGGSSFGGLAAFEMAQQFRARGHEVALIALLDTGTPDYPKLLPETSKISAKFYSLTRRFQQQRDNLKSLDGRGKIDYALAKLAKVKLKYRRKIRDNYKKFVRKFYASVKGNGAVPKSYIQLEDQIWRAGQRYVPKVYPGDVTLFRATLQPLGIVPDATLGWENLVGGKLEIHEVPGHHGSIVAEPYVSVLAEKLKFCIEKAESGENSTVVKSQSVEAKERKYVRLENVSSIS